MESSRRPSAPPSGESPDRPLSPVVHRMILVPEEPPPQATPVSTRAVWEEMGMPAPSPPAFVDRGVRRETTATAMKLEAGGGVGRRTRVVPGLVRRTESEAVVRKAEIGLRVCGLVFCIISLSVMAADKTQGWAGDSFFRYKEYRYCIAMTVIGFVYSSFQIYQFVHNIIFATYIIPLLFLRLFDFFMDQILAYLLMSASSAAAARTDNWVINWGEDEFTKMATASIGMSFMAFISFALSSLISAYYLFNRMYDV